jgi:hypothetical protein
LAWNNFYVSQAGRSGGKPASLAAMLLLLAFANQSPTSHPAASLTSNLQANSSRQVQPAIGMHADILALVAADRIKYV